MAGRGDETLAEDEARCVRARGARGSDRRAAERERPDAACRACVLRQLGVVVLDGVGGVAGGLAFAEDVDHLHGDDRPPVAAGGPAAVGKLHLARRRGGIAHAADVAGEDEGASAAIGGRGAFERDARHRGADDVGRAK